MSLPSAVLDTRPYLATLPNQGELAILAEGAVAVPPLPRMISPRRVDVFQGYQSLIQTQREKQPICAMALRLENVTLATGRQGEEGTAIRTRDGVILTDLFAQTQNSVTLLDAPPRRLSGKTAAALEVSGGENYYHFLLTAFPKLLLLMHRYHRHRFDHVLVNDAARAYVAGALSLTGVPPECVVSAAQAPVVELEDGYFASVTSDLLFPHSAVVDLFRATFGRRFYGGQRIYISRRSGRTVSNESEVMDFLRPRGFVAVALEEIPFAEQVKLFAAAECVIGPHGAGMANLVFCPPQTRVLELFAPTQVSATYWFLATSCQHVYHAMIGQGADQPLETMHWRSQPHPTITIEMDDFSKMMRVMGM